MKKFLVLTILALAVVSCGKYDEGPGFSLISKKNRITNTWTLNARTSNGQSISLTNYTAQIIINEDEKYNTTASYLGLQFNENGTWKFSSDKSELLTMQTGFSNTDSWEIIRLTKDELKLKYISGGDTIVDTFIGQ
jgi:hypothetical protein